MLVDTTELSEEQMGEIFKVQQTLDYLVRLNRSLLLLSKIEGGQFPECEQVDFNALARRAAADFGELYAARRIRKKAAGLLFVTLLLCVQGGTFLIL